MEREEDMSTTPANAPDMSQLYAALVLAQSKCRYIQMTGVNKEQGYRFASDEDIMKVVNPAMTEAGLVAVPLEHRTTTTERTTKSGSKMLVVDLVSDYLVAHVSGQSIVVRAVGSGQDTGDKAVYKAITGSLKYLYRALFALPIGLDAEVATPEDKPAGKPKETKEEKVARQAEHHPSWTKDQPGFMKSLVELNIAYDDFVDFLQRGGKEPRPRPSLVDSAKRGEMLSWLRGGGRDVVLEWLGKRDENASGGGR